MDRLSELPDSLIFHIFWLLHITDVVRTTILSKRWKNLWTAAPYLTIYHTCKVDDARELRNFVNRALLRWNGVRLLKFKVESNYELHDSINGDTDLWVHFGKHNQAEELYLHMDLLNYDFMLKDWVPQCLYSCSSLKVLSIKNGCFRIKGNVQWNQLKSLTIIRGLRLTEVVINQILCGSPQLEVLIMSFVERGESLSIRSTSLKELSICKYSYYYPGGRTTFTELRIWTPNLETLKIRGLACSKLLLMNVSSLNRATFGYYGLYHSDQTYCGGFCGGIDGCLSTNHFLGDLFGQVLPSIQHVENVTLLPCCLKVLRAMIEGCMNSSSPNVTCLHYRFHCSKVVVTTEICPLSKKLVTKVEEIGINKYEDSHWVVEAYIYLEFEKNLPMSFVLQLRTVEVTLVEGDNIFPFLEFLLKNASKLEKIVFRVKGFTRLSSPSESLLRASQKLLKMPRSSRTAHFTFCEY